MRIPLEFYDHLRNHINLSDIVRQKVSITKKGVEYNGLCPFHSEKTPSFTVNDIKKFYHCFGCGAHGDIIKFTSSLSGLSYKEAAINLANEHNIEIPKLTPKEEKLYEEEEEILLILQKAEKFFQSQLTENAIKYLNNRSIDSSVINEFSIGFSPSNGKLINFFETQGILLEKLIKAGLVNKNESGKFYEIFSNRIIFPIKNIYNKVVGFGGRTISDALPKYLNSPETIIFKKGKVLYGENEALTASYKKNYSILVEGYLDVITLHKAGFTEAVASLGTAVNEFQLKTLWKYCDEILICLDGDSAGKRASKRLIDIVLPLVTHEKTVSFIELPDNLDPHDCIINKGANYFSNLIKDKISLSNMIWKLEYEHKQFLTAEDKASLSANLEKYCLSMQNSVLKYSYSRFFKDQVWQYLIMPKKAPLANASISLLKKDASYTKIELLEYGLCSLLIKFPGSINHSVIKDFFYNVNFKISELSEFKEWFLEEFSNIKDLDSETIAKKVETTRFYKLYVLLLKNAHYLPINTSGVKVDYVLLWKILKKKYYLAVLKEEYDYIMQSTSIESNNFDKANSYKNEIFKITEELDHLTRIFLND